MRRLIGLASTRWVGIVWLPLSIAQAGCRGGFLHEIEQAFWVVQLAQQIPHGVLRGGSRLDKEGDVANCSFGGSVADNVVATVVVAPLLWVRGDEV